MMLLGRWGVAAGLGLGLVLGAGTALGQTAKTRGHVVQPDDGPPPDQAVQPDPPAQYEHAGDPEPPPEPEPPVASETVPDPPMAVQATEPSAPQPDAVSTPQPPAASAAMEQAPPAPSEPPKVQNQLQKDTAALLQLAQDLRTEIERAGSNTLSLAAIRKVDAIQKLSKNLIERMKDQGQVTQTK